MRSALFQTNLRTTPTIRHIIPWTMVIARALLGPALILAARAALPGVLLALLVIAGLLSDIFDGVLARSWSTDTAALRLSDSMADIVFYLGCGVALWLRSRALLIHFAQLLELVIALELFHLAFALIKFGKPPSYHSWLAKSWGLLLSAAIVLGFHNSTAATTRTLWWVALLFGIVAQAEGISMSLLFPTWRRDVKTIAHAWRQVRRRDDASLGDGRLQTDRKVAQRARKAAVAALLLVTFGTLTAHAQKHGQALYESGTAAIAPNTTANLSAAADGLRFDAATPLVIPYDAIDNTAWRKDVREHMGFFPAMFVGMVAARVHIYRLTLSYHNEAGVHQAAVFQVDRDDAITLSELLRMRAPQCKEKGHCAPLYDY